MSNYEISAGTIGYTVLECVAGHMRKLVTFDDRAHAEGLLESLDAAGLLNEDAPILRIQVDARRNTCQQVRNDMQDVALQSEHAKVEDWREITPESAVEIASWWGDDTPGAVGFVLDKFAEGVEVEVAQLLADIELTRAAHPHMDVFNVNALDYLMTFVTRQR
jgi:hypothetical protein